MPDPILTHDHALLSERIADLLGEAEVMGEGIRQETADVDSPELRHLRSAHDSALDLVRSLARAAKAAREGETG